MAQKQLYRDSGAPTADSRITPKASLLSLLEDSGGQLSEHALLMEASYSTDACRRMLEELGAAGEVECREAGCGPVVCLADAAPSSSRTR